MVKLQGGCSWYLPGVRPTGEPVRHVPHQCDFNHVGGRQVYKLTPVHASGSRTFSYFVTFQFSRSDIHTLHLSSFRSTAFEASQQTKMARFATTALIFAALIAVIFANAHDGPFPDAISVCGKGVCKDVGVFKDANGMATAIGLVPADAELGKPGDYPIVFSLCGLSTCVTVPVIKEAPVTSTCPDSIGLCGDGACKVIRVHKDQYGAAVSVGPVHAKGPLGTPGSYPSSVGVCCNGVCKDLPVWTR
ncbi:hypothetical protein BSKO_02452 [Bryopsis sp. KO-2023]|nr:hypothetical protein BSKO_02452 [Bryopsis sp. KO-2023]